MSFTIDTEGKKAYEHERRFVPNLVELPFDWKQYPYVEILQGYLSDAIGTRIRDEKRDVFHRYTKTVKTGEGITRWEDEYEISEGEYLILSLDMVSSLRKSRFYIIQEGIELQLNIFEGLLQGYAQFEVEFQSNEDAVAFIPPKWLGYEVTHDIQHGNYSLAQYGLPRKISLVTS